MVELQHRTLPTPALTAYVAANPGITVADFDSQAFAVIKATVRADLNQDQGGLCVYCEKPLASTEGQLEHIKPKAGPNGQPQLCFTYTNFAHSCINRETCGQKKKNGLLPIEPGPGCNDEWELSTHGTIEPIKSLSRQRRHAVVQTRDMLGLNRDATLVDERKRWLEAALVVLRESPDDLPVFLATVPYRHVLGTVL